MTGVIFDMAAGLFLATWKRVPPGAAQSARMGEFHHALLPEPTRAGITLAVISHDDRYVDDIDLPGRIVRMDESRFVKQHSLENA